MAHVFNWIRPGYKLVNVNFEWNVQVPLLKTDGNGEQIPSPFFSSQPTPDRKWKLWLYDEQPKISICAWHCNSEGEGTDIIDPVLVKISILDGKGLKIFQQMLPSQPDIEYVDFLLNKEDIIQSQCQQADGSLTFRCKILSHVKKEPISIGNPPSIAINCNSELITQLEGLFDGMKFSDVIFKIGSREFPAHKSILAARSEVFAAMFEHPSKEKLTNQIEIEDIEPEVFKELLRFIYTGRLSTTTMETMAVGLLIAADKYLLVKLKNECENYLLCQMSPVNCVELLFQGGLLNPAEHLEKVMTEAAKFFRRLPSEVMATAKWEKIEEENPSLLLKILKVFLRQK